LTIQAIKGPWFLAKTLAKIGHNPRPTESTSKTHDNTTDVKFKFNRSASREKEASPAFSIIDAEPWLMCMTGILPDFHLT